MDSQKTPKYCMQGIVLFSPLSPLLSVCEFKTWQIPLSQTIFPYYQLCMGEFKTGQNRSQVKRSENNPGRKNPVYSN